MKRRIPDTKAYEQLVGAFRKNSKGITVADLAANTGLSIGQVNELVPMAADEYSGRLEVTESGEILYSFPRGLKSRYRGFVPAAKRIASSLIRFSAAAGKTLFKVWIMAMLIGYFLLFLVIALASLFISVSANSNNRRRGHGGLNVSSGIFDLVLRLWFYSELTGVSRRGRAGTFQTDTRSYKNKTKGRPLHKSIFSFVFGDEDPNKDREILERKAFISYLRKHAGVVSLPELMLLTGKVPQEAESIITGLCVEFGGTPELTEEGTLVYRFDEILFSADEKKTFAYEGSGLLPPLYKTQKNFSSNSKKMNFWFGLINGINLLFGSYFLFSSISIGAILSETVLRTSGIYGIVYYYLLQLGVEPLTVIRTWLGLVPLLFSFLFWIIPAIRSVIQKKENEKIRRENFRIFGFGKIWSNPGKVMPAFFKPAEDGCRPRNLKTAQDMLIKEMGSYSLPEVLLDDSGNEVFNFAELSCEKQALLKYRAAIDSNRASTGKVIFSSDE